jgi:hypothetical protein
VGGQVMRDDAKELAEESGVVAIIDRNSEPAH